VLARDRRASGSWSSSASRRRLFSSASLVREPGGGVLCPTVAGQHPKTKLDTAAHEVQAASERGGLRPYRIGELLLVREGAAEPGGQHGATSRQQLLDHVGVGQDRFLGDISPFERGPADHQLEPFDAAALEPPGVDAGDGRQPLELIDHAVEMDHGVAPVAEIRSRGSSRVATDESRTRSPT